nr:MAG TPA: NB glycoprotein [Caudoviricetes sp.]
MVAFLMAWISVRIWVSRLVWSLGCKPFCNK